jgi:hypothetical protein
MHGGGGSQGGEGTPLPALPYIDGDTVKRLGRKKIRSLADLMILPAAEREANLVACGAHLSMYRTGQHEPLVNIVILL